MHSFPRLWIQHLPPRETWEATRVRANEPVTWQRGKFGHQNPLNFEVARPREDRFGAWFLLVLIVYIFIPPTVVFSPFLPVVVLYHWIVCVILLVLLVSWAYWLRMVVNGWGCGCSDVIVLNGPDWVWPHDCSGCGCSTFMCLLVLSLLFICFFINVIFCPWFCGWFWWFHAGIYAHFVSKRRGYGPSEAESCAAGWTQQRSVSDNEHNSARGRSSLAAVLTRGLVKRVSPVAMARRLRGWILIVLWLLLQFNAVDCRHILPAMDTLDKVWPGSGVSHRILREASKYDYTLHCLYIR